MLFSAGLGDLSCRRNTETVFLEGINPGNVIIWVENVLDM
jgi:hypothetical protein